MTPLPLGILASSFPLAAAGSYDLLETEILTGSQASVTFSSLGSYSDYQSLQIRLAHRDTRGINGPNNGNMYFNGDTAANYSGHRLYGNGSTVSSYAQTSSSSFFFAVSSSNSDTSGLFAATVADILDPFETTKYTTVRTLSGMTGAASAIVLHSGSWRNTDALTSISMTSTSGNWAIGSRFSLYGLRSA